MRSIKTLAIFCIISQHCLKLDPHVVSFLNSAVTCVCQIWNRVHPSCSVPLCMSKEMVLIHQLCRYTWHDDNTQREACIGMVYFEFLYRNKLDIRRLYPTVLNEIYAILPTICVPCPSYYWYERKTNHHCGICNLQYIVLPAFNDN